MAVIEQIVEATRNPRWLLVSYWLHGKPHFWGALYSFTYHSAFKKNDFIPRDLIPPSFVPFKHLQLDFIQLTLSMVINMFLLLYICFLDGMKPSPAERLTPSQWPRNCQKMCFHSIYQCLLEHNLLIPYCLMFV